MILEKSIYNLNHDNHPIEELSFSGFSFESCIISLYFTAALAHSALTARSVWESLSTQSSWSATLEVIRGEIICKIKGFNIQKTKKVFIMKNDNFMYV